MPKKKNWFARIKDLFFPVSDEQEGKLKKNNKKKKKKKKKKKLLLGWLRTTRRPPSLAAPLASEERTDNNTAKDESNQMNLTVASPAVSDGAGASTSPRFGGVSLPTSPTSTSHCEAKASESEHQVAEICLSHSQLLRHVEDLAAIKIQTAFRGYLARKALRALKGLVRLQAIIRGRAVRRQAVATLKSLQSIVSIHSQVCATRYQVAKDKRPNEDGRDVQDFKHDGVKVELSSPYRRWDDRLMTKEEESTIYLSKTDAMMRRHRMKAYSFNHRHSADQWEEARRNGRLRSWLEEHDEEEDVPQKEVIKRVDTIGGKQMRPRSTTTEAMLQESPAAMIPRRPLHRRKRRPMSDGKMDGGEPAYMAATESARARARPTSCSPRLRPMQLDCYSDGDSPYKLKLSSPMSSINSERTCSGGVVSGKCMARSSCKGVIKLSPKPYFDS